MVQSPPQNPRVTQSPLMFAPQPPTQSSLHLIKKEKIVSSSSSSAYPKQDMFLFLNPRGQYDFTKTHLQSKELPDMNYASNTRKRSTFLERCQVLFIGFEVRSALAVSSDGRYLATRGVDHHVHIWDVHTREHVHVTRTLFLPYDSDTEPRSSTLVHLIEVSRSALTMPETSRPIYHAPASDSEKAPYVAKANESQG
ncbi:hypothetical protein HID58_084539 [Brassica napus]|uniref:Transducin/WD40 repeat-like superfamily protein n=1 Tax=Brassica napus TaxID=3708 RepID=A0ABQ7XK77_BRANA|nr:hypothetical protein HID58_084539 [Brassica napus]